MIVTSKVTVAIRRLPHGEGLPLPVYSTAGSAGADIHAALAEGAEIMLEPSARAAIPTGLAVALPEGYEIQVRPRSGLAAKHGITIVNAPGTIDSDYRGEIKVLLVNLGEEPFPIRRGERIAQLVLAPVTQIGWMETNELPDTARGEGGFGSTGV